MDSPKLIPLSALQHFAFCPRQCALIHNEREWAENWLTAQGQQLHQRVDSGVPETRKGVRYERAVEVSAPKLGLVGKLDLIEVEKAIGRYTPVEYKRGKSKADNWDRIQLCAQALCLEEMLTITIAQGMIWYSQTRTRELVNLEQEIRQQTLQVIGQVKILFESTDLPKAKYGTHCKACSLEDICMPKLSANDHSKAYVKSLMEDKAF